MAWTHFKGLCSTSSGFAVGPAGSESVVISTAGAVTVAGAVTATGDITTSGDIIADGVVQNEAQGVMTVATTDGGTSWHVAPYACNVTGYVGLSVSSGTGRVISVVHGSAGDNALSIATGATGTIGKVLAMTASAVPSFTAGEIFRVVQATCATAQVSTCTIIMTKTA